jgi:NaMN:DMB phosphoribosyltransferase
LESTLLKVLLLLALAWLSACSPDESADVHPTQAQVGAWTPTDAFNHDVQEAARFAVQTFAVQNKARVIFKEVIQARQQVVAGLHLQLKLLVTLDGATQYVNVTVWRQLDGDYRLQSWDWVN